MDVKLLISLPFQSKLNQPLPLLHLLGQIRVENLLIIYQRTQMIQREHGTIRVLEVLTLRMNLLQHIHLIRSTKM